MLKDFRNVFYCSNTLPRSQLDPPLTSGVHTLIAPLSSLSIESHREEEVVQSGAVKMTIEGELLNDEVYISAAQVVRKMQRIFCAFVYGEEIIRGCVVYVRRWEKYRTGKPLIKTIVAESLIYSTVPFILAY